MEGNLNKIFQDSVFLFIHGWKIDILKKILCYFLSFYITGCLQGAVTAVLNYATGWFQESFVWNPSNRLSAHQQGQVALKLRWIGKIDFFESLFMKPIRNEEILPSKNSDKEVWVAFSLANNFQSLFSKTLFAFGERRRKTGSLSKKERKKIRIHSIIHKT